VRRRPTEADGWAPPTSPSRHLWPSRGRARLGVRAASASRPRARAPGCPRGLFKGIATSAPPFSLNPSRRASPPPRKTLAPPPLGSSHLSPSRHREVSWQLHVEVRSTLVRFAHVPALRSTQSGSPVLRRRRRSPSATVRRRRRPGSPPLGSLRACRRPGVFPVGIGTPQPQTLLRRRTLPCVAARCWPLAAARACAAPGPPDPYPMAQIHSDPSQPERTGQPLPGLCLFAKEPLGFLRFASWFSHRIVFLTDRSRFLRFSPGSLVFLSD
jgi:hypothetical protein